MASRTTLKKTLAIAGIIMNVIALSVLPADASTSDRLTEIRNMLAAIPTGQEALRTIDEYGVEITFISGAGSYYDDAVVIDLDVEIAAAALLLVHEATHVRYHNSGLKRAPEDVSRNAYVHALLTEEADAEANVVEAKLELDAAGFDVTKSPALLEPQYANGYRQGIELGATNEERERNARDAARTRLHKAFYWGEVVRSTDGLKYGEVYGNDWDKVTFFKMGVAGDLQTHTQEHGWFVA